MDENAAMTSPRLPWAGRLLALLCILLSAFNLRTAVTSLTPLLDSLGQTFGFGATMTGVFGMVPTAAFAVFGVLTPRLAHRIGLERTALLSMLLAAAGLLVRSFAGGTGGLLGGSIVALAGMGIGNVVLPPLVKRYFPDRVGTVSTLYITVLQLGTMLPALAAVPLAQAAGWRVSLGIWSLLAVAAVLSWLAVLWQERRHQGVLAAIHDRAVATGDEAPELAPAPARGKVWRSPLAWGMSFMFGMTSLITYTMFTWLPKLLAESGASEAFGGTMTALFAALGLLGALLVPGWATRVRNPFPLVAACVLAYLAAFAGLWLAPMQWPVLWVVLLGLGPTTFPLALTLINLRTRTAGGSAALSGFTQGVGYTMSCTGPLLFGVLHEATGGWTWSFAFLVLCVGLMLAGAWQACRPRMLEDHW
ncbi:MULTISPECIES: CynX/NimT family MFS transporter [unclassified Luteimonas]